MFVNIGTDRNYREHIMDGNVPLCKNPNAQVMAVRNTPILNCKCIKCWDSMPSIVIGKSRDGRQIVRYWVGKTLSSQCKVGLGCIVGIRGELPTARDLHQANRKNRNIVNIDGLLTQRDVYIRFDNQVLNFTL